MTEKNDFPKAGSPKGTSSGLLLAVVVALFVLNFAILGYSTKVALEPLPGVATAVEKPSPAQAVEIPALPEPTVIARYLEADVPTDPDDAAWKKSIELSISLGQQDVVLPFGGGSVAEVGIRALHDGEMIAFRLEWADETTDISDTVESFGDAVALQFPVDSVGPWPSAMMGERGKPVNIWQWRANWQSATGADAPESAEGTWYPPSSETVAEEFLSRPRAQAACVEFLSEGWGTLTRKGHQGVRAYGRHADGRWSVVFHRPLGRFAAGDAELPAGEKTALNVAVWNGSQQDVNGFKSVAKVWTALTIEPIPARDRLVAKAVTEKLFAEAESALWDTVPRQVVSLVPQKLVAPFGGGSVPALTFQAVHNGRQIAFRLDWRDETPDWENGVDSFKDAVALQFPIRGQAAAPSPLMGERDKPVAIWQWRSDWQADVTGSRERLFRQPGRLEVAALSLGELPKLLSSGEDAPRAAMQFIAAGWGTLTLRDRQSLSAHGLHSQGRWSVVFIHDLTTSDAGDPEFLPGQSIPVNFAVWNGAAGEVNGYKSVRMTWLPLDLEATRN